MFVSGSWCEKQQHSSASRCVRISAKFFSSSPKILVHRKVCRGAGTLMLHSTLNQDHSCIFSAGCADRWRRRGLWTWARPASQEQLWLRWGWEHIYPKTDSSVGAILRTHQLVCDGVDCLHRWRCPFSSLSPPVPYRLWCNICCAIKRMKRKRGQDLNRNRALKCVQQFYRSFSQAHIRDLWKDDGAPPASFHLVAVNQIFCSQFPF